MLREKAAKRIHRAYHIFLGELECSLKRPIRHIGNSRLALEHWLQFLLQNLVPFNGRRVIICAMRNPTWIEWSVYCACMIRRWGYATTLVYRASEIERFYFSRMGKVTFWHKVKEIPDIEIYDLDTHAVDIEDEDMKILVRTMAIESVAYDNRLETIDITEHLDKYEQHIQLLQARLLQTYNAICTLLTSSQYHRVICYSGIISDTPSVLQGALKCEVSCFTVEGWWRPGQLIYNFNKPALEFSIKDWLPVINKYWGADEEKEIDEYIRFLEGEKSSSKAWLKDFYLVQKSAAESPLAAEVQKFLVKDGRHLFLLSPNVIGDSATINRRSPFKGQRDWIEKTIDFFRENPHMKMIIRAHPAETWMSAKVKIKLGEFAREKAKGAENILVLLGNDSTNTFSIIPHIRAGLVWVSTVGVDMVIKGKTIICAANPKYSGLGFTIEPETQESYFKHLANICLTDSVPNETLVTIAKKYHHIVYKRIGFMAYGKEFKSIYSNTLQLQQHPEHDSFYKLLCGETPVEYDQNSR